jgi:hypothetical protein
VTRRAALALLVLAAAACGDEGYANNDAVLAVHQKAKEMCSCLFVMELPEAHCAEWTRVTPNVARATVDRGRKRVHASALGLWAADARFDGRYGCVLVGQ